MRVEYKGLDAEDGVLPRLKFILELRAEAPFERFFTVLGGDLHIVVREQFVLTGRLSSFPESIVYEISPGQTKTLIFYCDLTPYQVEALERLRGGGDLWLRLAMYIQVGERLEDLLTKRADLIPVRYGTYVDRIKIAKSEWVEGYLPKLGYRRVRLIEVPLLPERIPEEFKEVPAYLEEAWKHFSMGDYDEAVSNCRRVMMAIATALRKLGYEKMEVDEKTGEEKPVPNWKKFFAGHETLAESFEKMFRGLYGFLQPGAHIGRAISRPEAECALMNTYSLANYVVKTGLKLTGDLHD
ncbi:MAG: hypothetical protein QXK84_07420 [Nitrososphaerota archaeon]